jgi:hypothetical protein
MLLREQTAHLLAALHSEGIEALAAQLQQLAALGVAQLYCYAEAFGYAAHRVVGARTRGPMDIERHGPPA